jgi:hypothetical protein
MRVSTIGAAFACALLVAPLARADVPVSVGNTGATQRASQTQDAVRNSSAASFGSPTTDDRRIFQLRWRLPFVLLGAQDVPGVAFASGFRPLGGGAATPGVSFAAEPMQDLSPLIPQFQIGEPRKLGRLQLGVVSMDIGHGSLVDDFTNSPEGSVRRAGLGGELNLAGLGASLVLGDIFAPGALFAGRVHGRPIMWFTAPEATFEPNELDIDPRTEITGVWVTGLSWALDAEAPLSVDNALDRGVVFGLGWDNEAALLDNQVIKLIGYLDLNMLLGQQTWYGAGAGAHPGVIAMLDVLGTRIDVTGEYALGTDAYVPRYFDRAYFVDRTRLLGGDLTKAVADAPASHGYNLRLKAGLLESLVVYAEAQDNFAFDPSRGSNSARATVGLSGFLFFLGGHVALTQAGIQNYLDPGIGGPGFMVLAEGRVALIANILHLVGRYWRVHDERPREGMEPLPFVDEGAMGGIEVNFDVF